MSFWVQLLNNPKLVLPVCLEATQLWYMSFNDENTTNNDYWEEDTEINHCIHWQLQDFFSQMSPQIDFKAEVWKQF